MSHSEFYWRLIACISLTIAGQSNGVPINNNNNNNNECAFSMQNRILTCENITDWETCNIENHLTNDTRILMLKNGEELTLNADLHTEPFESLSSYHVTEMGSLTIEPFAFSNLTALEYVKICDNRYDTVAHDTFFGLNLLKVLNLNNNSIKHLDVGAFNDLYNLETLELTHNDFQTVPGKVFDSLQNLKSLFLYHNNIQVLQSDSLAGLKNLNVLDLTYNRIAQIRADMFNGLPITQLYLSYNQIESIEGDFTSDRLEFIYLQNNKLKSVVDSTFSSLVAVVDIDLSRNKIEDISEIAFYNCTKLTNLNYKDNALLTGGDPVNLRFAFNVTKPFVTS